MSGVSLAKSNSRGGTTSPGVAHLFTESTSWLPCVRVSVCVYVCVCVCVLKNLLQVCVSACESWRNPLIMQYECDC